MKKELKLFLLGFIILCMAFLVMPSNVLAAEPTVVTTLAELETALADDAVTEIKLTKTIAIDSTKTIDGNNKTVTFAPTDASTKAFTVHGGTVEFKNITIVNPVGNGRCIDVRDADVTLTLTGVTLKTTNQSTNNQALNVGGYYTTPVTINVVNSTIEAGKAGYAIIVFNPTKLTIDNSTIKGYAAIYMKDQEGEYGSAGSEITVKNGSKLIGINDNADYPSNSFATIVFEDTNIKLNIIDSKVEATGESKVGQSVFGEKASIANSEKGNTITVSGKSEIVSRKDEEFTGMSNANSKITVAAGVTSNVEIPEENIEEGTVSKEVNGEYVVFTEHKIIVETAKNGTVKANAEKAIMGEEITLTVEAEKGYELKSLTVNGTEVKDNKFVMPDKDATIKAEFSKIVVKEEVKDEEPKMGTEISLFAVIAVIALAGYVVSKKK